MNARTTYSEERLPSADRRKRNKNNNGKGWPTIASGGSTVTFSYYGGWGFNKEGWWKWQQVGFPPTWTYVKPTTSEAEDIATNTAALMYEPFFDPGDDDSDYNAYMFTNSTSSANSWLCESNQWRVIAGTVPAMSLAAGRNELAIAGMTEKNMNGSETAGGLKPMYWPDRGGDPWKRKNWMHSMQGTGKKLAVVLGRLVVWFLYLYVCLGKIGVAPLNGVDPRF